MSNAHLSRFIFIENIIHNTNWYETLCSSTTRNEQIRLVDEKKLKISKDLHVFGDTKSLCRFMCVWPSHYVRGPSGGRREPEVREEVGNNDASSLKKTVHPKDP